MLACGGRENVSTVVCKTTQLGEIVAGLPVLLAAGEWRRRRRIIYRQQMEVLNVLESIEAVLAFGWDVVFLVGTVDQEYGCEDVDAQVWRWRTLHKHFEKFDKLWLKILRG